MTNDAPSLARGPQTAIDVVRASLRESAEVAERLATSGAESIVQAAELIAERIRSGGKLLLCGNGGSAADCQHMAAELVSRLTLAYERPAIPAIALTTDSSILTAYANDFDFSGVFARQVEALGGPRDVLLAISTSGRSRNVLGAVAEARQKGIAVIALVGEGGPLAVASDVAVLVPAASTQLIQQAHLAVEHLICHLVERSLHPRP
jgi:phosphoheptose isomerase